MNDEQNNEKKVDLLNPSTETSPEEGDLLNPASNSGGDPLNSPPVVPEEDLLNPSVNDSQDEVDLLSPGANLSENPEPDLLNPEVEAPKPQAPEVEVKKQEPAQEASVDNYAVYQQLLESKSEINIGYDDARQYIEKKLLYIEGYLATFESWLKNKLATEEENIPPVDMDDFELYSGKILKMVAEVKQKLVQDLYEVNEDRGVFQEE